MQQNYVQHPTLKSVNEKCQSLMGGKLFSFGRTVFNETKNGQN